MIEYRIVKDIQPPIARQKKSLTKEIIDEMEIGDCVIVQEQDRMDNLYYTMKYWGFVPVRRSRRDGFYVWKLDQELADKYKKAPYKIVKGLVPDKSSKALPKLIIDQMRFDECFITDDITEFEYSRRAFRNFGYRTVTQKRDHLFYIWKTGYLKDDKNEQNSDT